jgi:hypothetical protein
MPWLEEEDELLKAKLGGIKVYDDRAPTTGLGRDVKVWFRFPEPELRNADYPFLTIDLINIEEALDRAQRGGQQRPTVTGYRPPDMTAGAAEGKTLITEWPVAMNLDYQITTWARNIQHDRQMLRQLWAKFPGRYGSLGGKAAPYVRPFSCQLMNMVVGDRLDEFGKRLFKKVFTMRVFSELWASEVRALTNITDIDITLPFDTNGDDWFTDLNCYED